MRPNLKNKRPVRPNIKDEKMVGSDYLEKKYFVWNFEEEDDDGKIIICEMAKGKVE